MELQFLNICDRLGCVTWCNTAVALLITEDCASPLWVTMKSTMDVQGSEAASVNCRVCASGVWLAYKLYKIYNTSWQIHGVWDRYSCSRWGPLSYSGQDVWRGCDHACSGEFSGWKQMMRLNWERHSDQQAWQQVRTLVVEKYSRFLWSMNTSIGVPEPLR